MKERLTKLIKEAQERYIYAEEQAQYLMENGVIVPPCKVGDTVYKICPKCNEHHNGNCKNCAWRGCIGSGCDIGVRVYSDGSYNEHPLQIVQYKVTENRFVTILKYWNVMYFSNAEHAEKAKTEYDEIRNVADRKERYKRYLMWEESREQHYSFLKGGEQG